MTKADEGTVEPIHFSRMSTRTGQTLAHANQLIGFGLTGLAVLICYPLHMVLNSVGVADYVSVPALLLLGAGLWAWWYLRRRRARHWREPLEQALPAAPDDSMRIQCVGVPAELKRFGPLEDVPFEPSIFHAALAVMPRRRTLIVAWILASGVCVVAWASVGGRALFSTVPGPCMIYGTYALVMGAVAWLRPVYFRVVPGRLDVLWYSALSHKPIRVQRHDLKAPKVLVDLRRAAIFIGDGKDAPEYAYALVRGGKRLAYMVLLAALSTNEPGPLPDDELLG